MKLSNNMPQKVLFKAFFAIYTWENGDSENDLRYSQSMQKSDLIGQGDMCHAAQIVVRTSIQTTM